MNKLKSLLRVFSGKAVLCAVLALLFFTASASLFAQTAEVRYAGVFYREMSSGASVQNVYCDYSLANTPSFLNLKTASSQPGFYSTTSVMEGMLFGECASKGTAMNVGEIRTDGDFQVRLVSKKTDSPESANSRISDKNYSLYDRFYVKNQYYKIEDCELDTASGKYKPKAGAVLQTFYDNYEIVGYNSTASGYAIDVDSNSLDNRSFVYMPNPPGNSNTTDPWVSSALIEYDQPYSSIANVNNKTSYPNHCLALCMNVYCTNKPIGGSTYSIAFPLQQVKFDIVKYYNNKNVENPEETPAIRTIDLYPNPEEAKCGSYKCPGSSTEGNTCNAAQYYSIGSESVGADCYKFSDGSKYGTVGSECTCPNKVCNYAVFNGDGIKSNGNEAIPFCAAWDGSYEIAGEFGKSNGQYAFRATVATDTTGDNIITDKIEFNSIIAYPGMNQIPIQVDVTNIHTVRSTPSVVGNITAVSAQPYTYAYRLSKDADVRIAIFDASNGDNIKYGDENNGTINVGDDDLQGLVRTLVDWQPRLGEGLKGVEKDVQITEFDSWDGRNDNGMLLPAGNYVVSLQAKSQDEWPGVDFSRAVTRQLSLDPLRLTDIQVTGLNKQSTGYASISYVPTEPAKIYWNIYTPGTSFEKNNSGAILTDSSESTGKAPTPVGGSLVYSSVEDRTGRMNFTSRWDGLCNQEAGCARTYAYNEKMSDGELCGSTAHPLNNGVCTETFANGAPMPDGNYVYVLWAEIPYNGKYLNAASGVNGTPVFYPGGVCGTQASGQPAGGLDKEINNQCFTGVKTLKYNTGMIAIERGMVDITIQPVSYSTIGSSPTAYGLDPFIFKYSVVREATAVAKVENTAGVVVKYLTPEEGVTQVAQQLNTLSWDGRDDAGRMVTPGTYMFVVETKDAMFPAVTNRASAVFPVDMYRVVDVSTTDVYGDSEAKATISYHLSKAMNVQVNIYNKDVVIPAYNNTTGDYGDAVVTASYTGSAFTSSLASVAIPLSGGTTATLTNVAFGTTTKLTGSANPYTRDTITAIENPNYVAGSTIANELQYKVTLLRETVNITANTAAAWPPRICDKRTDSAYLTDGHIDPAKNPKCIYVNDTSFTNYPDNATIAASGVVDVRLQPVKTFDRSSTRVGDGMTVTEEWDALYFYNPTSTKEPGACKEATDLKQCPYEMVPDGQYPFFISARSDEPFDRYYANGTEDIAGVTPATKYLVGAPFKTAAEVVQQDYLYATDKPVSKVNVTRGPVYFLDGSTVVYPNSPQLFNVSSGPIFIPPYEINFAVSRAATVEVAIVALEPNVCNPDPTVHQDLKQNKAGDVCKFLSTMTIMNTSNFDPNVTRKIYWDGTDNNGFYVKSAVYEIRLTAKNYPDPGLYQETVKSITLNADLLKVFDLLEADGYALSQRNTDMKIGYQISVPMKVAIQIFKPGTTIFDYQKGTLRNPTTGKEVQDIHEVLVRALVGIRPATTSIEESWDGRDYAQQEVPDGTYPFRFVTALNSSDIDSITGEILGSDNSSTDQTKWDIHKVADTYEYQNLHKATVAIGDGRFVCEDWEKTVFFYPNPLKDASKGTLEITKMPVPGTVSIKFFNLAGDLVRDGGYTCVDANNYTVTMGDTLTFNPDNIPAGSTKLDEAGLANFPNIRNAALRCRWDRTNQHGRKVARGVYFGLVDFKAQNGREHCQKVVKVLVP
ncbi:MAG: hypothetical protein ACI351_00260 [Candidatus Avelusimicrobium sp.]|uniref:hypothetical protein n=1 Tax=Candidatus Avelusimicrobium sp. TaxID=3048833 RepID=UPI003EFD8C6B